MQASTVWGLTAERNSHHAVFSLLIQAVPYFPYFWRSLLSKSPIWGELVISPFCRWGVGLSDLSQKSHGTLESNLKLNSRARGSQCIPVPQPHRRRDALTKVNRYYKLLLKTCSLLWDGSLPPSTQAPRSGWEERDSHPPDLDLRPEGQRGCSGGPTIHRGARLPS